MMSGKSDQAKGKIKEAAGALTDDDKLKKEGQADQRAGDAKEVVQNVADKAEKVIDDVKQALHKD
jgi:uncharacterized protein YjbJ (UPF0337 family)